MGDEQLARVLALALLPTVRKLLGEDRSEDLPAALLDLLSDEETTLLEERL